MFCNNLINIITSAKECTNRKNLLQLENLSPKVFCQVQKLHDIKFRYDIKFRWFQIKTNNTILVTNSVPRGKDVVANNLCIFCHIGRDTIYYYLWHCQQTKAFWPEFERCLKEKCFNSDRLSHTPSLILFGYDEKIKTDAGYDFILLVAKFFVYNRRTNKNRPHVQGFLKELANIYKIDRYAQSIVMKQNKFALKWLAYQELYSRRKITVLLYSWFHVVLVQL